jgi:hypothetical protein
MWRGVPAALAIASAIEGLRAYLTFTKAALFFKTPKALITSMGILSVSLAMSKFYIERYV